MGTLLCRKAVFWRLLAILFLLFAAVNAVDDDDDDSTSVSECRDLKENALSNKKLFLTCTLERMMIEKMEKKYLVADFSEFTQDEFNNMTTVKDAAGDKDKNEPPRLFCGNFLVQKSELRSIEIGFYKPGTKTSDPEQSFVLESNQYLENVTITTESFEDKWNLNMKFIIKNNRRLSNESLEALRALHYYNRTTSYIQQFGECTLDPKGLSSIDDLEDCHYTTNDFIINKQISMEPTKELLLKAVNGCITITNTKITDLSVLNSIEKIENCAGPHEISLNKELCLHPEAIFNLRERFSGNLVYNDNSNCSGICSTKYLFERNDSTCQIINGTLVIKNQTEGANLTFLENIKEIRGRLVMSNNELSNLNLFPNLALVDSSGDTESGAAIEVQFNYNLTDFELPKTLKIKHGQYQSALKVMLNGKFNISDEDCYELEQKYGNGSVTRDQKKRETKVEFKPSNSSSKENESDAPESSKESSDLTDKQWIMIAGIVGGVLAFIVLAYLCLVCVVAIKRRKKILKDHRVYESELMIKLSILPFSLPPYPFTTTKRWITDAAKILEKNATVIKNYEKERLRTKVDTPSIIVQKNATPIFPLYSRTDHKHQTYMHEIGKHKQKCLEKGCIFQDEEKRKNHRGFCVTKCRCIDYGIQEGENSVYGVRMEQVPVNKWKEEELEKIHLLAFKGAERPITFEEPSFSTVKVLGNEADIFVKNEFIYQKVVTKNELKSCIRGVINFKQKRIIKNKITCWTRFVVWAKGKVGIKSRGVEKALNKGCVFHYNLKCYEYDGSNNEFEDIAAYNLTPKPPNLCLMVAKTFFTICSSKPVENKKEFMEDMINAHLSCPYGKWLSNYTVDDITKLCSLTKESLGSDAYVEIDDINVRIIGEIRGKFEDLRKALSMPSVNADTGHPVFQTTHVFLGNYSGPHQQNLEVICLLFALRVRFGKQFTLLRGALEWREMGCLSGLTKEIFNRFPDNANEVCSAINIVFDQLPLVCKVGTNILCSNAGVAPKMKEVKDLSLPISDLILDTLPFNLMFAQPNWTVKRFFDNVEQKGGYYFGYDALETALNDFECDALFCTKKLESYGVTGPRKRLYTLCSFSDNNGYIAQAEYDAEGILEIQVLKTGAVQPIEYSKQKPRELNEDEKNRTCSSMNDVVPKSMMGVIPKNSNEKSTMSAAKTQCDSVMDAPPPLAVPLIAPGPDAPAETAAPLAPSSGPKS